MPKNGSTRVSPNSNFTPERYPGIGKLADAGEKKSMDPIDLELRKQECAIKRAKERAIQAIQIVAKRHHWTRNEAAVADILIGLLFEGGADLSDLINEADGLLEPYKRLAVRRRFAHSVHSKSIPPGTLAGQRTEWYEQVLAETLKYRARPTTG